MKHPMLEPDGGYAGLCPPGLRQSGTHGLKERKGHYRTQLAYVSPNAINATPIFSLSGGLKKQSSITDAEYRWHEKRYAERSLEITVAYAAATSGDVGVITLKGSTFMLHEGVTMKNHFTGEIFHVICSPTVLDQTGKLPIQVQVVRGFAGTSARAFDPADPVVQGMCGGKVLMHIIGTAFPENSCTPISVSHDPHMVNNFTSIMRKGHAISGTALATGYKFGPKEKQDKLEIAQQFNEDVELTLLFSEMSIGQKNGKIFRTTHGLVPQIRDRAPDNFIIRAADSKLGWTEFEDLMVDRLFRYGSNEKLAFAGPTAMRTLRHLVRMNSDKVEMDSKSKVFGRMQVTTFYFNGYMLHVHEHPMFRDAGYPWQASMLVLDMADLEFLVLKGRDVKYRKFSSIEASDCGLDGNVYGWIMEACACLISASRHGVIQNLCEAGEDCFTCATPTDYTTPEPGDYCDPCLNPVQLDSTNQPYSCETCGSSTGCGCGEGGAHADGVEPLAKNEQLIEELTKPCDDADDDGVIDSLDADPNDPNVTGIDKDDDGRDAAVDTDDNDPLV